MNSPPGKTMFGGQVKPAINFVDRTGQDMNGLRFFRPGYSGAWFARCLSCGRELLLTKDVIRRGKKRCCETKT